MTRSSLLDFSFVDSNLRTPSPSHDQSLRHDVVQPLPARCECNGDETRKKEQAHEQLDRVSRAGAAKADAVAVRVRDIQGADIQKRLESE